MKSYVFLTPSIVSIGGAELYISSKVEHLRTLGWTPIVFSFSDGEIKIRNLAVFKQYLSGELSLKYAVVNGIVKKKLFNRIKNAVAGSEEVFIESHTTNLSYWGEYLASIIKGVHLSYLLTETFPKLTKEEYRFFTSKKNQGLLRGIQNVSITNLLADGKDYNIPRLGAVGGTADSMIDYGSEYDFSSYRDSDFKILSLGRLNKPYVVEMLKAIRAFSKIHSQNSINVTLVGGYFIDEIRLLCGDIAKETGIVFIYIDECNPIPHNIFSYNDMAIAVAGCACICTNQGLPTITVDANDNKAIGILGITTNNTTLREKEKPFAIESLIEDILLLRKYKLPSKILLNVANYEEHDRLLYFKQEEYFLKCDKSIKEKIAYLLLLLTGVNLFRFLLRISERI